MTYSPGSPGYPPANQPTTQFSAPTQQFGKAPDTGAAGADTPSKLPTYLLAAVAVLGLAVYLSNFGPIFTIRASDFLGQGGTASGSTLGIGLAVVAAVLAGLIAAAGLLPKQRPPIAVAAVVSLLGFLLVLAELINKPSEASIGWALYLLIAFSVLQAAAAVAALLFDSGVVNAPAPRPKYEQQPQYGQYGGPQYYGQPQGQQSAPQHHGGPAHQQPPQQQRPGYPSQYGGGYGSGGPSTGGFPAIGPQNGPPTPPTGFPTYGQPHQQQQPSTSTPTTQLPSQPQSSQPPSQSSQSQSSSSQQSGPTPS